MAKYPGREIECFDGDEYCASNGRYYICQSGTLVDSGPCVPTTPKHGVCLEIVSVADYNGQGKYVCPGGEVIIRGLITAAQYGNIYTCNAPLNQGKVMCYWRKFWFNNGQQFPSDWFLGGTGLDNSSNYVTSNEVGELVFPFHPPRTSDAFRYEFKFVFEGDTTYAAAESPIVSLMSGQGYISDPVISLNLAEATITPGKSITVSGIVSDPNDGPMVGAKVHLEVYYGTNSVPVYEYDLVTNVSGVYSKTIGSIQTIGQYKVIAWVGAASITCPSNVGPTLCTTCVSYGDARSSIQYFSVVEASTKVLPLLSCEIYGHDGMAWVYPGDTYEVKGRLFDTKTMKGIPNYNIVVTQTKCVDMPSPAADTCEGTITIGSFKTDSQGYWTSGVKNIGATMPSTYLTFVAVSGASTTYQRATDSAVLNVIAKPAPTKVYTKLECCIVDPTVQEGCLENLVFETGKSVTLKGTLLTNDGFDTPIKGAKILVGLWKPGYDNTYSAPGSPFTTDDWGNFTVVVPASWQDVASEYLGSYTIECIFSETSAYMGCECETRYEVIKTCPSGIDPSQCYAPSTCEPGVNYNENGRYLICTERNDCQHCYVDGGPAGDDCVAGTPRPALTCPTTGGVETCLTQGDGSNKWVITTPCPVIVWTNLTCVAAKNKPQPTEVQSVSGYLKTAQGVAIPGAILEVNVTDPAGNTTSGTAATKADGSFTMSFALSPIYGQWVVSVDFAGTTGGATQYRASTCTTTFQVSCVEGDKLDPFICDDGSTVYGRICQNGVYRDTNQECPTCQDGSYADPYICEDGHQIWLSKCVSGVYVPTNERCTSDCIEGAPYNQKECWDGSIIYEKICLGGTLVPNESCPNQICQEGETRCQGNVSQICQNNQWVAGGGLGCECSPGQTKCQNGYYWSCNNGQWQITSNPCDDGGGGGIFGNIDPKMLLILGGAGVAAILGVAMITRRPQ